MGVAAPDPFTPAQRRVIERLVAENGQIRAQLAATEWLAAGMAGVLAAHAEDPLLYVSHLRDMSIEAQPERRAGPLDEQAREHLEYALGRIEGLAMKLKRPAG